KMSHYRNTAWFFFKGIREYTRGDYLKAFKLEIKSIAFISSSANNSKISRTGANSGTGKVIALEIAKRGGAVHMVCRDQKSTEEIQAEIVKETGNEKVFVHILDLSEARKIWDFSERFRKDHETLNVLINNAGCMINQRGCTAEGMEMNFATNTLSTYILTTSLIPLLEKSEDPRVITVSSGGMLLYLQSEKGHFDGTMVYAQTQCQQVVMTEQWSQTHKTIHFSVMHTGWVDTPGVRSAMSNFYSSVQDKLRTPEQGADTVVWLAVSGAAVKQPSGLFFQDRKTVSTHLPLAWTRSSSEEQTFMKKLEKLANSFKPQ
uniref:Dehydrogenase/reductase 12-like a n=1 Tax=Latimeria chalumnae TaxID=7897 RepID=H3A147_LATCH